MCIYKHNNPFSTELQLQSCRRWNYGTSKWGQPAKTYFQYKFKHRYHGSKSHEVIVLMLISTSITVRLIAMSPGVYTKKFSKSFPIFKMR